MRLIDKDALMDEVGVAEDCKDCRRCGLFGCGEDSSFSYACDCITDAPTIVEVVRCKDCKYYTSVTARCEIRGKGLYLIRGMNDFCSRAERREQ